MAEAQIGSGMSGFATPIIWKNTKTSTTRAKTYVTAYVTTPAARPNILVRLSGRGLTPSRLFCRRRCRSAAIERLPRKLPLASPMTMGQRVVEKLPYENPESNP